jgi:GNAT superfamily N-acetyltransferase
LKSQDFEIKKASFFDMNRIVKMALYYHKEDPKSKGILSNRLKLFLYKFFGPLYVWLTLTGFKAVVSGETAGYILIKKRDMSIHIWDLVVDSRFRRMGIGKGLMEYVETYAKNDYQYSSLAVMEDNTPAIGLYRKLGYENLQFSPICYLVEKPNGRIATNNPVKLEPISGEEAVRCRKENFSNVLNVAIGEKNSAIVNLLYPLSTKLRRRTESFRILASGEGAGYLSSREGGMMKSVFVIIDPKVWHTVIEEKAIMEAIEYGFSKADQFKICVMQSYERNLESLLRKTNSVAEREIPRLALIKRLA